MFEDDTQITAGDTRMTRDEDDPECRLELEPYFIDVTAPTRRDR
jgi:hypothetical protein